MGKTDASQIITLSIFIISYILIFSGRIERSIAALLGLFIMTSAGYLFGFFTFDRLISHVDWDVVILLFGMMTYVGLMAKTGFFKYIGIKAIKLSGGKPWLIFLYLSLITTFVSMVIDNVTTILLMIPLTMEVADMLGMNPIPVMLGEAVLSNVGGVGTMIGDPPNIMIGLFSGHSFNDFVINLFPPVLASLLISIVIGRVVYRRWVGERVENMDAVIKMRASRYIRNKKRMKFLLCLLFAMIFFFATGSYTGISPAFVALSGAIMAMLLSMTEPKEAFKSVEWSTLVFFIALFSLVGGLQETGLLDEMARRIASLSSSTLMIAIIILWVSGISSSFVDNIPITAAFIPVVASLSSMSNSSIIWWALAMGVGMGGNITPIGSSAGVITVGLSKRYGHEIGLREWMKFGSVVGLASMVVCTLFLFLMA